MTNYTLPLYQHKQETWNIRKCERMAKLRFIPSGEIGHYAHGRIVRYNGGCVREGEWWQGEEWPLPLIPDTFEFYDKPTWGTAIRKKGTETKWATES